MRIALEGSTNVGICLELPDRHPFGRLHVDRTRGLLNMFVNNLEMAARAVKHDDAASEQMLENLAEALSEVGVANTRLTTIEMIEDRSN